MKLRSVALAMALLTGGAAIGATTQHLASASVSSGERPVLIPIEPCRLADTRPAPNTRGPRSAPLGAGDTHTIDAQQSGVPCSGVIPTDASALSLNITALGATEQSFLTVWAGGDRPLAASLNPAPGQPPVPNAVTTELSVDQEFRIYNDAGSVNVVVDVNGYYVDHNHDDRYYTKAQADANVSDALTNREWLASMPISAAQYFTGTSISWNIASGGSQAGDGLTLHDVGYGRFWHGFTLPPQYTGGSDVIVTVTYVADTDNTVGCTFRLEDNGTSAHRPGVPEIDLSTQFRDGPAVGSGSFPYVILNATNEGSPSSFRDNIVQSTDLVIDGTSLLPGDRVLFALARRSDPLSSSQDTCTGGLTIYGLSATQATS